MLTPLDIESKVFTRSVSGYSIGEVKQFMKELLVNYEKLYRENIELSDKVNLLNEGIQYYKTIEDTLQNTLLLAEKTAEDTKLNARQKAEQIIKEAEIKADAIINDAQNEVYRINKEKESLIRTYDASKIQMRQFLKAQLELTEKNVLDLRSSTYDEPSHIEDPFSNEITGDIPVDKQQFEEDNQETLENIYDQFKSEND